MTAPRWGDRVGTPRICALCGRSGFDVKPGLECQDRAVGNGIAWPSGLNEAPTLALPGFAGDA